MSYAVDYPTETEKQMTSFMNFSEELGFRPIQILLHFQLLVQVKILCRLFM